MAHCYNENSDISQKYLLKVTPPDLSIYNGQFYASKISRKDTFFSEKERGGGINWSSSDSIYFSCGTS